MNGRLRVLLAVTSAVASAILLSSCANREADATIATYTPEGTGGDSALLEGVVVVNGAGCLAVELAYGSLVTPLFPEDEVTDSSDGLFDYRGTSFAEGDPISLRGGLSYPPGELPDACSSDEAGFTVATSE